MSAEDRRENELRRLLAEAVEPVEPGPGAQTRLLARARSQAQRKRRHRADVLRWAVPVTVVSLALIFAATFGVIAARNDRGSSKGASTAAGSASISAPEASSSTAASAAGPSRAPNAVTNAPNIPSPLSVKGGAGTSFSSAQSDTKAAEALLPSDLDGDGVTDAFALNGGQLLATLSRDGTQTVELPPTGTGARVLGIAALSDPSGNTVPALFVRLNAAAGSSTDTIVTVVSGHLAVVQKGSGPVLLTIDVGHGYGCDQRSLAVSGDTRPYVIDGSQLVASPQLRAVLAPAGKTSGCF